MVKNIQFKNVKRDFPEKLREDINEIKTSAKVLVAAGKSRHNYKMGKQQYTKLLTTNFTKFYKKSNKNS